MLAPDKAQHVLRIYADRVEAALEAFKQGDADIAFAALKRMNEAYHNFRVVEAASLEEGRDPLASPEMQELWHRISKAQIELNQAMESAKKQSTELITRISDARRKVASFRSGSTLYNRFEKSV